MPHSNEWTMKLKINKKKLRKIAPTKNAFLSLAKSIISQQISGKAADSIYKKFIAHFSGKKPTPEAYLKLNISQLKSAGISSQKAGYLRDLAEKFIDKTIDHKNFHKMSDAEVKEHLVRVKGIGPWTADMFLIFALNRPDVLPVGDLGTRKGFQKAFKLKSLPSEAQMRKLALPHKGEHTALTLHLWGILDKDK
jgi:DNA-3-methyladenine glycosylase II